MDEKIEQMVQKTESFFEPGTTTYIFTSDHGMTDWGAHGSGSTEETETPFVIWGAGVNKILEQQAIEQVDFAPLISSYLGIPIPVNNEVRILTLIVIVQSLKKMYNFRASCDNSL